MLDPEKLAPIRGKDPVINTFTWEGLKSAPQNVEQVYGAHAITHMSLGDTGSYVDTLRRNITKNKHCSVGAIVGPYGYGKTSTAIHLWREMQDRYDMLSVPPFEWLKLSDILEAVTGWVEYKLKQGPRQHLAELRQIYERHRDKSLEEVAAELKLTLEAARAGYEAGRINLGVTPAQVITFLLDVCALAIKASFHGMAVFVDELQETADSYSSIKSFQSDLFAFADKIPTQEGPLALIFTMPDTLESAINTTRPDIIHRLSQSALYLRVEAIYGRAFPEQLWQRYAEVFDFEEERHAPISHETLDSIGQIAMRRDLGAGPRTVINALVEAVKHYELSRKAYTPFDLVNGFLERKISFEEQGKFSRAVRQALENRLVASKPEYGRGIKLLAAFPLGCSQETLKAHGLAVPFDQLLDSALYGDLIYRQSEGYTLRSLLEQEVSAEPTYVRLVRDQFIRSYVPDAAHARQAMDAFREHILGVIFETGQRNQLDRWQWKTMPSGASKDVRKYWLEGSFSLRYPYRDVALLVTISSKQNEPKWEQGEAELNFVFDLVYSGEGNAAGRVLLAPEKSPANEVLFQLNLMTPPPMPLNIPRLPDLYPPEKMTPLFMLSLLQYLDDIGEKIPQPEKTGELPVVRQRLLQYAMQSLLGPEVEVDGRLGTQDVGQALIRSVFQKMCLLLFPQYVTIISSSQWQKHMATYNNALHDPKVTPAIARGKEALDTTKEYITRLFGQTSLQTAQTLITQNLATVTRLEWGKGRSDEARLWFVLHPLEQEILQHLRNSPYTEQRSQGTIHLMPAAELFEFGKKHGYTQEEMAELIKVLAERQYIVYDARTNSIEQLIRSFVDLKEALSDGLSQVEARMETLNVIDDFDPQRYHDRLNRIRVGAQQSQSVEEVEELATKLRSIESGVKKYIATKAERVQGDLRSEKSKVQPFLSAGVPDELTRAIAAGAAPWAGALEDSRQRLRRRYDELVNDYKGLAQNIESSPAGTGQGELTAESLVELVKIHALFQEQAKELANRRAAITGYQNYLRAWQKLLQRANLVQQDALTAKASFDEPEFFTAAQVLWDQISAKFKEEPLDTLNDHEMFANAMTELERKIGDWQRRRREDFVAEKQRLEDTLRSLGDERPILKTNFDAYIPPYENRINLRGEAVEHFQALLAQYESRSRQLHSEIIYVERVQQISGGTAAGAVNQALNQVRELQQTLSSQDMAEEKALAELATKIRGLSTTLAEVTNIVRGFITRRSPEGEGEKDLLQIIQEGTADSSRGVDLTEVLLRLMADNPNFALEKVMGDLQSLFKKNQVIIRVQSRR